MEKRKWFETAKIYVAYNFLMSFIGNDNVATTLSITVMELECISEQVLYEGDTFSGNFVAIDLRQPHSHLRRCNSSGFEGGDCEGIRVSSGGFEGVGVRFKGHVDGAFGGV
ncbi:hypothetical protein ACFX13_019753 [Malus domestica]